MTTATTTTREAAVFFGERPQHIPECHWHPWRRVRPATLKNGLFSRLVLHRALRDRGGIGPDETLTVHVYTRQPAARVVHWTQFLVGKP